jgi:DNA-directed RNA polymerase subunit RPC12/RpoP
MNELHPLQCPACGGKSFVKLVGLQHGQGLVETPGGYVCHDCGQRTEVAQMIQQAEIQRLERELRERQERLRAVKPSLRP